MKWVNTSSNWVPADSRSCRTFQWTLLAELRDLHRLAYMPKPHEPPLLPGLQQGYRKVYLEQAPLHINLSHPRRTESSPRHSYVHVQTKTSKLHPRLIECLLSQQYHLEVQLQLFGGFWPNFFMETDHDRTRFRELVRLCQQRLGSALSLKYTHLPYNPPLEHY